MRKLEKLTNKNVFLIKNKRIFFILKIDIAKMKRKISKNMVEHLAGNASQLELGKKAKM